MVIFTLFAADVLDQHIVQCVLRFESTAEINRHSWTVLPLQLITYIAGGRGGEGGEGIGEGRMGR